MTAAFAYRDNLGKTTTNPSAPDGATIERFDVQRSAARAVIARAVQDTAIDRVTKSQVPGSRVRNCHVGVVLHGLVSRRYALPVYVLAYRYDDKPYRAIVHGQDARIAFGDAPLSWRKIMGVIAAVLAVLLMILLAMARR